MHVEDDVTPWPRAAALVPTDAERVVALGVDGNVEDIGEVNLATASSCTVCATLQYATSDRRAMLVPSIFIGGFSLKYLTAEAQNMITEAIEAGNALGAGLTSDWRGHQPPFWAPPTAARGSRIGGSMQLRGRAITKTAGRPHAAAPSPSSSSVSGPASFFTSLTTLIDPTPHTATAAEAASRGRYLLQSTMSGRGVETAA